MNQTFKMICLVLAALVALQGRVVADNVSMASWYGEEHRGRLMANGRRFNPDRLTAASWFYPFGTKVRVSHAGKSVIVEITDRGPAERLVAEGRLIDLSLAAFKRIAPARLGLVPVKIEEVQ